MPFIDLGESFRDAKETPLAPEGQLYDLICGDPDVGDTSIIVPISFESGEYRPMRHYLNLPQPRDLERDKERNQPAGTTSRNKMLFLKRFCYLFNIKYTENGFDTNDIAGARARANVSITEPNDKGDTYNQIVLPRLPDES